MRCMKKPDYLEEAPERNSKPPRHSKRNSLFELARIAVVTTEVAILT